MEKAAQYKEIKGNKMQITNHATCFHDVKQMSERFFCFNMRVVTIFIPESYDMRHTAVLLSVSCLVSSRLQYRTDLSSTDTEHFGLNKK